MQISNKMATRPPFWMISKMYFSLSGQIFKPIDPYTSEKSLTTDVQTSIGNVGEVAI